MATHGLGGGRDRGATYELILLTDLLTAGRCERYRCVAALQWFVTSADGPVFVGRAAESDLVAVRVAESGIADAVGVGLALGWQLGLDGGGVGGLAAALAGLARGAQQPVEGGQRTR